jgi:HEPN domain-containing protein
MTPDEWRRNEAHRWLAVAARDLHAARLLASEEPPAALFHCQQAAEKSAEAFLAFHDVAFRRTHDLNELASQCIALNADLAPILLEAAGLTEYAVVFRYLDAPREPDEVEVERALAAAQRLYDGIRGELAQGAGPPQDQ